MGGNTKSPKGRFAFRLRPKEYYIGDPANGRPAITPKNYEPVWDKEHKCVVVALVEEDGSFSFADATVDILEKLQNLEDTAVFSNARAFIQNRKVYRFFFDNVRKTVRLDPELRFDSGCRYYRIREATTNTLGIFRYVTGMVDSVGTVISQFVDMEQVVENGSTLTKSKVGGLTVTLIDATPYVVEFYDAERRMVNSIPFESVAVKVQDIDLTSDNAIVGLIVSTNRAFNQDGDVFFYQGEPVNNLEYRVYLKYANGKLRDVTYEQREGGRLQITGLASISTAALTGAGTPQKFTVKYFMVRDNAGLTPGETAEGAIINDIDLTISRDINVHVVDDVYDVVDYITPAAFIIGDEVAGTAQIALRIFAHYVSGANRDITSICTISGFTSGQSAIGGPTQSIIVNVPQGHGSSFKTFNFTVTTVSGQKFCLINSETAVWRLQTSSETSLFNLIIPGVSDNSTFIKNSFGWSNDLETITKEVTHYRIRHVTDSKYVYTQDIPITQIDSAAGFGYTISQGKDLTATQPLVVEFLNIVENALGQPIEIFVTGSKVAYVTLVA